MIWLLIFGCAVGFWFFCLLLEDLLFEQRQEPPGTEPAQQVLPAPPPLPAHIHCDLSKARAARAAGAGRHRRPQES